MADAARVEPSDDEASDHALREQANVTPPPSARMRNVRNPPNPPGKDRKKKRRTTSHTTSSTSTTTAVRRPRVAHALLPSLSSSDESSSSTSSTSIGSLLEVDWPPAARSRVFRSLEDELNAVETPCTGSNGSGIGTGVELSPPVQLPPRRRAAVPPRIRATTAPP
jgi:hypothetical protein